MIALEQIGHLNLLKALFSTILVPPAVILETAHTMVLPAWIAKRDLTQPIGPQILSASLGPGESETISLALEVGAGWVILDDRPARRMAQALNLQVIGTLGVLLASKRRGFLPAVRPCLDELLNRGFYIAPDLYKLVLSDVGEGQ